MLPDLTSLHKLDSNGVLLFSYILDSNISVPSHSTCILSNGDWVIPTFNETDSNHNFKAIVINGSRVFSNDLGASRPKTSSCLND